MEYLDREYAAILTHLQMAYAFTSEENKNLELLLERKGRGKVVAVYLDGRDGGADEYIHIEGDEPLAMVLDVTYAMNQLLK